MNHSDDSLEIKHNKKLKCQKALTVLEIKVIWLVSY